MMTFLADIIAIFESPTKKEGLFAIIMLPGQFLGTSSSDTDKRTDAWWDIFYDMKNRFWAVGCGLGWAVE